MGKRAIVFGGQGSQYEKMGLELLKKYKSSIEIFEMLTEKQRAILLKGTMEELSQTENLQPIMLFYQLSILKKIREKIHFHGTLGLSLGEYGAMVASGVTDEKNAMELVKKRASAMGKASKEIQSKMVAVLKTDLNVLQNTINKNFKGHVYISNINSSSQTVLAGELKYVDSLIKFLKEQNIRVVPLKVSGAFHTPFMQSAAEKYEEILQNTVFESPKKDYYPNLTGELYRGQDMVKLLKEQITSPVLLYKSLDNMVNAGYDQFIEVGPGKTISTILKKDFKNTEVINIDEFNLEEV
ncbi:malonyl-CoA-[acyl-carrier-protein] transacylase [Peptoniphilus sp. ING2-D1G]|nr:malonyl-CoA-[acyl-carrier-protein] transacylase [Peptoniphilus sp. ING2-D1G]